MIDRRTSIVKTLIAVMIVSASLFSEGGDGKRINIGLGIDAAKLPDGNLQTNDYANHGGYFDLTAGTSQWEVYNMTTTWDIIAGAGIGATGFVSYWFSDRLGTRLSARYIAGQSSQGKGTLVARTDNKDDPDTAVWLSNNDIGSIEWDLQTIEIKPSVQFTLQSNDKQYVIVALGPSLFFDNIERDIYLPVLVLDNDSLIEAVAGPIAYDTKTLNLGLSVDLIFHMKFRDSFFIEPYVFFNIGGSSIYDLDSDDQKIENGSSALQELEISNEVKSVLRDFGIGIAFGIGL